MRVLVLDGNENQAVAAVRSLAAAGHEVHVGSSTSWSKAGLSRDAKTSFRYPAPQDGADAFVAAIAAEAAHMPGTLVIPMTERTTLPLSAHRDQIAAVEGKLVLPAHDAVLEAFDKRATTRLAESLGIDVPRTWVVTTHGDHALVDSAARFPVVVKPAFSEEINAAGRTVTTGAPRYARDATELRAASDDFLRVCSAVVVQEFVDGEGAGYFALMRHGELRLEFAHRRIRDVRPTGSGSAVRESVAADPRIRSAALAVLRRLHWHGVAMVEFRIRPDGSPVFLEVNGRFWNSLALAVYSGADFPAALAAIAEHGDAPSVRGYRIGVRCRWILGDVRHLLAVWRGAPAGYPRRFPGRLCTLAQWLRPVRGTYHDNFTLRDPLPEIGDWLDVLTRRLPFAVRRAGVERNVPNGHRSAARA